MILHFDYTNYKGERSTRCVKLIELVYTKTEHHPQYDWFLRAFDVDKEERRMFRALDIRNVNVTWMPEEDGITMVDTLRRLIGE